MTVRKYCHYCFGRLSWCFRPDIAKNTAEMKLLMAFRRDLFHGSGAFGYPVKGDKFLDTIGGTSLAFGDGTFTGMLRFEVIDVNERENWLLCRALEPVTQKIPILHTYSEPIDPFTGEPWQVFVQSCYRIGKPEHVNNPEGSYRLQTRVEFITGNSAPEVVTPVVVNAPCNSDFSFPIVAVDPDGDSLSCRLATGEEASGFSDGFLQPGPPHSPHPLEVDDKGSNFLLNWNTAGTEPGQLWSYQVIVEDGKTQVGVDALIRIIEEKGEPPYCSGPDGSVKVRAAVPFTIDVSASDPDGQIVEVQYVNLPPWANAETLLELPAADITVRIKGNPRFKDNGLHPVLVIFTDNDNNQTVLPLTIEVNSDRLMQFHPCQGG